MEGSLPGEVPNFTLHNTSPAMIIVSLSSLQPGSWITLSLNYNILILRSSRLLRSRNLAAINLCKFTAKFLDSCYRVLSYLDLSYSPIWFFPTIMVSSRQKTKLETRGSHRLVTYLPSPPVIKVWRWRWKEGRLKACI